MSTRYAWSAWSELFDGKTLSGWHSLPRIFEGLGPGDAQPAEAHDRRHRAAAAANPAVWTVEDGAVVGRQATVGYGGYLVTDETFGDFELELEAKPDWPADTGIYLRSSPSAARAYQVLLDHRRSGAIAGFYGNGIGGFHAAGFTIDAVRDGNGQPVGLRVEDEGESLEPATAAKRAMLARAASPSVLLNAWRWDDWNQYRIRCVGRDPVITVWINGVLAAEVDASTLPPEVYDASGVSRLLGGEGRIALEVHDNDLYVASGIDPESVTSLGEERWGRGAACRWRRIRIRRLLAADDRRSAS